MFLLERSKNSLISAMKDSIKAQQKLELLYRNSPFGFAFCSMGGVFVETNSEFDRITGYTTTELNGLSYWDLTPEKYADQEAHQLKLLNTTGRYGPYRKEYRAKNGQLISVELNGFIVEDYAGKKGIWSVVEDITEKLKKRRTNSKRPCHYNSRKTRIEICPRFDGNWNLEIQPGKWRSHLG